MSQAPKDILREYWGFEQFRPLQEDIIQSALDGKDTLALLPTGGGKSICFQVPALAQEGVCLVISPLIALMKDQVENLRKRGIRAEAVYSGMHAKDIDRIFDNCVYGKVKFLYLSPERLTTELARVRISRMKVNLLAVDEAHCISQWGYDFRPPYLEIANIRELLPEGVPVLALTATATPQVVEDIQEKLAFKQPNVLQKSFARSNLSYSVLYEEGKEQKLADIFRRVPGSGIVYVRNRRRTREVAQLLRSYGIPADFYHAGLPAEERARKQDEWMSGKCRVMACTNAFGMGIDKPDVRTVVHLELPDSLEAYFQEAGRAGRDGQKAYAVLLYQPADGKRLLRQFEQAFPPLDEVRRVYRALGSYFQLALGSGEGESYDFELVAFAQTFKFDPYRVHSALKILQQSGWIVLTDAVFVASSLRIAVGKETLYDYQLRHPAMDKLLKAILRSYQGAFNHPIKLREGQLAAFLKLPRARLQQMLNKLHQDQVVEYEPQRDSPQVLFLKERVDADNLLIDHQLHNFRKNRQYERVQQAIAYAENHHCRAQQLLAYFGEESAETCGVCDICTGRNRSELPTAEFEKYKDKIALVLRPAPLSLQQLMESFPPSRHEQVLKTLEYLLDEGRVGKNKDLLHWKG